MNNYNNTTNNIKSSNIITFLSYVFMFNILIACICLVIFSIIKYLRKDYIEYKKYSLLFNNSSSFMSFINFLIKGKDYLIFGESNYEAFLYLYFLRKTAYLFLKMTPIGILIIILYESNVGFFNNDPLIYYYCLTIYNMFNMIFFYKYLINIYQKLLIYYSKREKRTNTLMIYNLKSNLKLIQVNILLKKYLNCLGICDANFTLYLVPNNLKHLKTINDELASIISEAKNYIYIELNNSKIFNVDKFLENNKNKRILNSCVNETINDILLSNKSINAISNTFFKNINEMFYSYYGINSSTKYCKNVDNLLDSKEKISDIKTQENDYNYYNNIIKQSNKSIYEVIENNVPERYKLKYKNSCKINNNNMHLDIKSNYINSNSNITNVLTDENIINIKNRFSQIRLKNNIFSYYINESISRKSYSVAFISFETLADKEKVFKTRNYISSFANSYYFKKNKMEKVQIKQAKHHHNIIWTNLEHINSFYKLKMTIVIVVLLFLCFKIITPAALYSYINPLLNDIQKVNSFVKNLLIVYSLPLIVSLVNAVIVPYAAFYSSYLENHWLKSNFEISVLYKNFIILLLNTTIIPLLGSIKYNNVTWKIVLEYISNHQYYLIQYVIQVSLMSNFIQLLAIPHTLFNLYYKCKPVTYFDYAYNYAFSLSIFMIVICISPILPILPPLGVLFFFTKYLIDKYNICVNYSIDFDSGGSIILRCIYIMFFSMILMQFSCLTILDKLLKIIIGFFFIFADIYIGYKILNYERNTDTLKFEIKRKRYKLSSTNIKNTQNHNILRNSDVFESNDLYWYFDPPRFIIDNSKIRTYYTT